MLLWLVFWHLVVKKRLKIAPQEQKCFILSAIISISRYQYFKSYKAVETEM